MKPLLACILLYAPFLHAQNPCDTLFYRAVLNHSAELLDAGEMQSATDTALFVYRGLSACPQASDLRREAYLQTDQCYRSLATDFLEKGLFNRCIDLMERDIALHHEMQSPEVDYLATAYLILGNAQNLNGNQKLSIEANIKGLQVRQSADPADYKIAAHYDQIINNLIALEDTAEAYHYLLEWEVFHRKIGKKAAPQARLKMAIAWSLYYEHNGELRRGATILEDTLQYYAPALKTKSTFLGIAEFHLCELYAQLRDFTRSLQYAEKNVATLEARKKQQNGKLFTQSHYAWYLAQSARAAWNLYLETGDTAMFSLALKRANASESVMLNMRDRRPDDGFRDWIANSVGIVANLQEVRYGLFAKTGNPEHAARSFEVVEASKMFAVQEFLHETYALRWGGIPDSLFQEETTFRESVNELETNFFMLRAKEGADSLLAQNDQKLFALRDHYRMFLKNLEKDYPSYFQLKYSHPGIGIADVQRKLLRPGECMLDVSLENGQVFLMLIRPDTLVWKAAPFDEAFEQALQNLEQDSRQFTAYQSLPEAAYLQKLRAYADAAHLVFKNLIAPVRALMTEKVILIPRERLANLPFGALLTAPEENLSRPYLWHFLEKEYSLSQTYSAGLMAFLQSRKPEKAPAQKVLALAPFYSGEISRDLQSPVGDVMAATRDQIFLPLPSSGEEVKQIVAGSGGTILSGNNATKSKFTKACPDYKIIHLATHSAANDVLGEYSFVALQAEGSPGKIDLLYARDIYNLHLNADLVVLSACETALGQYRDDEGTVGLTRAFTCAGAQNIVASLWSVNDASTKELMVRFYAEIKKGNGYSKALNNAKKSFLLEKRDNAHPYYWAGFILYGR